MQRLMGLCACDVSWDFVHATSHGDLGMQCLTELCACSVSQGFVQAVSHRALYMQCLMGFCACNVSRGSFKTEKRIQLLLKWRTQLKSGWGLMDLATGYICKGTGDAAGRHCWAGLAGV